jgi:hypothetical protein
MSKPNQPRRVVVTQKHPSPTVSKTKTGTSAPQKKGEMIFGKMNFYLMIAGIVLIIFGTLLMAGGQMPNPDVWDENLIYSTQRTVIAPIVIVAGLGLEVVAIFLKKTETPGSPQA